jgi:hypothetical protein
MYQPTYRRSYFAKRPRRTFRLLIGSGPGRSTGGSEETYVPTNIPSHHHFINRERYGDDNRWSYLNELVAYPDLNETDN